MNETGVLSDLVNETARRIWAEVGTEIGVCGVGVLHLGVLGEGVNETGVPSDLVNEIGDGGVGYATGVPAPGVLIGVAVMVTLVGPGWGRVSYLLVQSIGRGSGFWPGVWPIDDIRKKRDKFPLSRIERNSAV